MELVNGFPMLIHEVSYWFFVHWFGWLVGVSCSVTASSIMESVYLCEHKIIPICKKYSDIL